MVRKLSKRSEAWLYGNVGITIILWALVGFRYAVVWFFGMGVLANVIKFVKGGK